MRRTDQWFHMPICRYLHFRDSAVAPPFPNLWDTTMQWMWCAITGWCQGVKLLPAWFRWNSPPHSSMRLAMVSASSSAIFRILLRPSRTTWTTWASLTVSRLQNGGITCFSMRCATCRGIMMYYVPVKWLNSQDDFAEVGLQCWRCQHEIRMKKASKCKKDGFSTRQYRSKYSSVLPDLSSHLLSGCWWPTLLLFVFQNLPRIFAEKLHSVRCKINQRALNRKWKCIRTLSSRWIIIGTSLASMTACTCCWLPAVMLDRNHTASYSPESTNTGQWCRAKYSRPLCSQVLSQQK